MREKIIDAMKDAEIKAWESLSGYKFLMFGYHASRWITYRSLLGETLPDPFRPLVDMAQKWVNTRE